MDIYIINLPKDTQRAKFQKNQFSRLGLPYEMIDAVTTDDISEDFYQSVAFDWERPLSKAEVCCFLSHKKIWELITEKNRRAVVLEDDAILGENFDRSIISLMNVDSDYINLEARKRKKIISKKTIVLNENYKLSGLYHGGTGAAGYLLTPAGANKLLLAQKKKGFALADAHICRTRFEKPMQLVPASIVQMDCMPQHPLEEEYEFKSNILKTRYQIEMGKFPSVFKVRRIISQLRRGGLYLYVFFRLAEKISIGSSHKNIDWFNKDSQ